MVVLRLCSSDVILASSCGSFGYVDPDVTETAGGPMLQENCCTQKCLSRN